MIRRLLAVSSNRDVNLQRILEHEVSAVLFAIFHDDGSMRKSVKSDLAKKLESNFEELQSLPQEEISTAYIIDCMALLQALPSSSFTSFNDLAKIVLQRILFFT